MSGFDNQFRTDQHNAQNRQFYDAQRYQSDRTTAGIIGGIPGRMQQAQMNQQAMELDQLNAALTEKQVESDLRMQEAAMEQQFHRNKLNDILMVDQVESSRLGVREQELALEERGLALEASSLEVQKRREAFANRDVTSRQRITEMILKNTTPEWLAHAGMKVTQGKNRGLNLEKATEKEKAALLKELKDQKTSGEGHVDSRRASLAMDAIKAIMEKNKPNSLGKRPPTSKEDQERLNASWSVVRAYLGTDGATPKPSETDSAQTQFRAQQANRAFEAMPGMSPSKIIPPPAAASGDPGAALEDQGYGEPPPGQEAFGINDFVDVESGKSDNPFDSPAVQGQAARGFQYAEQNPQWAELLGNMPPNGAEALMAGVGLAAAHMVNQQLATPDRASATVMDGIMSGGSRGAYFLRLGGADDEFIRDWLLTRPGHTKVTVEFAMKELEKIQTQAEKEIRK